MFKILGIDDSVNACECCGKQNLKSTVVVEVNGEILHYGSVCATRHTGLNDREIKAAIRAAVDGRKLAATKEYESHPAAIALENKRREAARNKIEPGKAFADYCRPERAAANAAHAAIREKFGLDHF
jgi:hypothetical protein